MRVKEEYADYYMDNKSVRRKFDAQKSNTNEVLDVKELNENRPEKRKHNSKTRYIRKNVEEESVFGTNNDSRKEILIDIIIDGTYSFSPIFLKVYYLMKHMLRIIREQKTEYRGVVIKYGLTVLHEEAIPCRFSEEKIFSESEDEFLEKFTDIEFYGGSESGREDLAAALGTGLRMLNEHGRENADRGVLFFSDSLPEEKDMYPDFWQDNQQGHLNRGLCFAVICTYGNRFIPKLKMVDQDGKMTENGINEMVFYSIEDMMSLENKKLMETIRQIVDDIWNQTSVSS